MERTAALMTDFTALGKCAASLALPVLACCGVSASILPTCVLSTHTGGLGVPDRIDMTSRLDAYITQWKQTGAEFDALSVGYLACAEQKDAAIRFIDTFKSERTVVILDPVMADNGKLYSGIDTATVGVMRSLLERADIVTPNYTEGCLLTGREYSAAPDDEEIRQICLELSNSRRDVVLTGIPGNGVMKTAVLTKDGEERTITQTLIDGRYHGTGDLFAAVMLGMLLNGKKLFDAVGNASDFVFKCIETTALSSSDSRFGLQYEHLLPLLRQYTRDEEDNAQ